MDDQTAQDTSAQNTTNASPAGEQPVESTPITPTPESVAPTTQQPTSSAPPPRPETNPFVTVVEEETPETSPEIPPATQGAQMLSDVPPTLPEPTIPVTPPPSTKEASPLVPEETVTTPPETKPPVMTSPSSPNILSESPDTDEDYGSSSSRSKKRLIITSITLVLLILFSASGVFAYMVTYKAFSTSNKALDTAVAHIVQAIPFAPKTPLFILESSVMAHAAITSAEIDVSLASENKGLTDMFGGSFEVSIAGPVDYTDIENPQTALNIKLDTAFEADITYTDDHVYFRVAKIPAILYTIFSLTEENFADNPLLNRWVSYDTSGLETSAQQLLDDTDVEEAPKTTELVDNQLEVIKNIFMNEIVVTKNELDGAPMYSLLLSITPDMLEQHKMEILREFPNLKDADFDELKQTLERIDITIQLSRETYLVHQMNMIVSVMAPNFSNLAPMNPGVLGISMDESDANLYETPESMNYTGTSASLDDIPTESLTSAIVIKLSDHGKDFEILPPPDATEYETYMLEVSSFMQSAFEQSYATESAIPQNYISARDTQRRSDLYAIVNAVYQYATDNNGSLPEAIDATPTDIGSSGLNLAADLEPTYITTLPVDPNPSFDATTTGYLMHLDANGRLVATGASELNPGAVITVMR